eukprot:6169552-Amphidinium_carterae.1
MLRRSRARWEDRAYVKWVLPEEQERPDYHQTYFFLHHKGRSSAFFALFTHIFVQLGLSVDPILVPKSVKPLERSYLNGSLRRRRRRRGRSRRPQGANAHTLALY